MARQSSSYVVAKTVVLVALVMLVHAGVVHCQALYMYYPKSKWDFPKDAPLAKAFCASPEFKTAKCGLATEAEVKGTIQNHCPWCYPQYRGPPGLFRELPANMTGYDRYEQTAIDAMSLACKGPVVVRSVFKLLDQPAIYKRKDPDMDGTDCTGVNLVNLEYIDEHDYSRKTENGSASPIIRCELELPTTGGSEVERASQGKETKCYKCGGCSANKFPAGCPSDVGKWYSETYTTVARGCDFDPKVGYKAHMVGLHISLYIEILLAKFEVCNHPGCFDLKYEQAKQSAAKACVKGKCAA